MKCPNCGAEINENTNYCEFCGSQISYEMKKKQEQLNKQGCPKCGSTNISFSREKAGEVKGKNGSAVIRSTVGVCKDCGYTWTVSSNAGASTLKKRKTWLWVLGWIFIFPIPLTILMLRQKELKPAVKYGIIAIAWVVYLIIGLSGKSSEVENSTLPSDTTQATIIQESLDDMSNISFVLNYDEQGEYGKQITLNKGDEFEYSFYVFNVPSGTYKVINDDKKVGSQVTIYKDEIVVNSDGVEEMGYSETSPIVLLPGTDGVISVANGECIKLSDESRNILFEKMS